MCDNIQVVLMDKTKNKDIFGRFVVAALVAYFIFKYNYEVTQFIHSGTDYLASMGDAISIHLGRTFDDAGILLAFGMLIVLFLWMVIQIVVLLVVAFISWLLVTLNDAYILPFLIPLLIVYSKFSYSFIATPILWLPKKVFSMLGVFGRFILRVSNHFIVLPIAEVIALKSSPRRKFYKILTSLLVVFGFCGVVVGGTGIAIKIIQDGKYVADIESLIKNNLSEVFSESSYTNIQHHVVLQASTPNWTQTTIQLRKGDVVAFTVTGLIKCISPLKAGMTTTNPNGIYLFNGYVTSLELPKSYRKKGFSPSYYILPDKVMNCFMIKVGTGEAFVIGSGKTYKVKQGGILFVGINQLWTSGAWKNNSGELNISIVIRRKV